MGERPDGQAFCKRLHKRRQKPLWTANTVVLKVVMSPEARTQREDGVGEEGACEAQG